MNKFKIVLSMFVFIFILLGFNSNYASAANCAVGDLFNSMTGKPCASSVSGGGGGGGSSGAIISSGGGSVTSSSTLSTLTIGSRGDAVKALQRALKDEGYYLGKIDGLYGKRTAKSVKEFQDDNDLPLTGIADVYTLDLLNVPIEVIPPTTCPIGLNKDGTTSHVCPTAPVISGVSGPQSLKVNETGTWSVSAHDSSGGSLSYYVAWGDEYSKTTANESSKAPMASQQSATFTHTYSSSGTYSPIFYVTNTSGQTAQSSLSVNVGGVVSTNHAPEIWGGKVSGNVQVGQLASFSWSANDADNDDLAWGISDWGDGSPGSASTCRVGGSQNGADHYYSTSHTYTTAGKYLATVSVNDCRGGSDSESFTVSVNGITTSEVLSTSRNPAFTGGTVTAGSTNQKIGSYIITAPSSQAVNLNSLTIKTGTSSVQNILVRVNGIQFGAINGIVNAGTDYSFSGQTSILANGTAVVDVYVDVWTSVGPSSLPTTTLSSCSGVGLTNSVNVSCSSIIGQNVIFKDIYSQLLGDANTNGAVNVGDALVAARHAQNIALLTGQALDNADVNGDGVVTSVDATLIANWSACLFKDFPRGASTATRTCTPPAN